MSPSRAPTPRESCHRRRSRYGGHRGPPRSAPPRERGQQRVTSLEDTRRTRLTSVCPVRRARRVPVLESHTARDLSHDPLTTRPSLVTARQVTLWRQESLAIPGSEKDSPSCGCRGRGSWTLSGGPTPAECSRLTHWRPSRRSVQPQRAQPRETERRDRGGRGDSPPCGPPE
jgi:hypothetical protein